MLQSHHRPGHHVGRNIGDLLNVRNITWGWFEGGFNLQTVNANGSTGCARFTLPTQPHSRSRRPTTSRTTSRSSTTPRPATRPTRGRLRSRRSGRPDPEHHTPDPANHQYDLDDFFAALKAGNLASVNFLKAPAFQDGHAGYSNPIDEQAFIVKVVNAVQESKFWKSTAIVILYDDSDGWYDHQMPPIVNPSFNPDRDTAPRDDRRRAQRPATCNLGLQQGRPTRTTPLNGAAGQPAWGRCGYGTRQPLLVISPFAKRNHIDHTLTDQASVLRFIEDNWLSGERIQQGGSFDTIAGSIEHMFNFDRDVDNDDRKLILDPQTGAIVFSSHRDEDHDHDNDHDHDDHH